MLKEYKQKKNDENTNIVISDLKAYYYKATTNKAA